MRLDFVGRLLSVIYGDQQPVTPPTTQCVHQPLSLIVGGDRQINLSIEKIALLSYAVSTLALARETER